MVTSQIALPLPPAREGDPEHIVIGTANAGVVEALRAPASWPFRTAILRGPPRSGTSLLGRWFEHAGLGETIDPADAIDETALFHRWNRAQEEGTALLLIIGGGLMMFIAGVHWAYFGMVIAAAEGTFSTLMFGSRCSSAEVLMSISDTASTSPVTSAVLPRTPNRSSR